MKITWLAGALVSISLFACDNHPGISHDQYVVSIRKRYEQPVQADTYSTAITEPQSETPAESASQPSRGQQDAPVSNAEESFN